MGLTSQFLHSYEIQFPEIEGEFSHLSKTTFTADLPARLKNVACKLGFNLSL